MPNSTLTVEQTTDLNSWYDDLEAHWLSAIAQTESIESQQLAQRESEWEAEQQYYHDQYLYDDRF